MKLWQLNVKLRQTLDRIGWPLVTRKRFEKLKENYEAELKATNEIAEGYLEQLRNGNHGELQRQLSEARKELPALKATNQELTAECDLRDEQLRQAQHRIDVQAKLIEELKGVRYYNVRGKDGRFTKKTDTV